MKVKKVGTGKSHGAHLMADKPSHPMPQIHPLKGVENRTDMLTTWK